MKFVIYTVIFLALVLIGFSISVINPSNLFEGDSANALIWMLAAICIIVLMIILLVSRKIQKKHQE